MLVHYMKEEAVAGVLGKAKGHLSGPEFLCKENTRLEIFNR